VGGAVVEQVGEEVFQVADLFYVVADPGGEFGGGEGAVVGY
jgi:hypothetical protein